MLYVSAKKISARGTESLDACGKSTLLPVVYYPGWARKPKKVAKLST
jgi:hypothetical protein